MPAAYRVRIVKNELGGSATQQELKGWNNGMNRGTGGGGGVQFEPWLLNNNNMRLRCWLGGLTTVTVPVTRAARLSEWVTPGCTAIPGITNL